MYGIEIISSDQLIVYHKSGCACGRLNGTLFIVYKHYTYCYTNPYVKNIKTKNKLVGESLHAFFLVSFHPSCHFIFIEYMYVL